MHMYICDSMSTCRMFHPAQRASTLWRPWGKVVKGVDEGDWLEPQQFDRAGSTRKDDWLVLWNMVNIWLIYS